MCVLVVEDETKVADLLKGGLTDQRLRRKLDDPFPRKLLQTIRGVGYALRSDA